MLSGPSLDLSDHDDVRRGGASSAESCDRRASRGLWCVHFPSLPRRPRRSIPSSSHARSTRLRRHPCATLRRSPDALIPSPAPLQAATAAAHRDGVTARTRTLQDSWRPVPGFDLDATFDAGDAPGGGWSASAASRAVAANLLAPAEPRLGEREESEESEENESRLGGFPFAPPKFNVYHDINRAYEARAKCARRPLRGDLGPRRRVWCLRLAVVSSLAHRETVRGVRLEVALPRGAPPEDGATAESLARAPPNRLRRSANPHFAANAGRDHVLFSAETAQTRNVPGAVRAWVGETARNVIPRDPVGSAGRTRDSSDRLTAPSASSRRVETMRGVTKNVDFVVVALDANEAEMHRLVRVARGRETTLVVTPARSAAAATTGRHLLAETEPWPAGQQRQYYAFREYPGSASAAREFGAEKARLGVKFAPRILTAEEREAAIRRAAKEVEKTSHAKHGKKASRETDAKEGAVAR